MARMAWGLYRMLRAALLTGLSENDRVEMDDLIAARVRAASGRRGAGVVVWARELLDLFRVWRQRWRFPALGVSWLDVKLGLRMLVNQPVLTCVAVFALAIGIPIGLAPLHVWGALARPLPVEDGHEIVVIRNWDRVETDWVDRSLHDFVQWREELSSFEDLGMARTVPYNVVSEDGRATPVRGAEVTASVFPLLRVPPLLGRALSSADEVIGAPDVVVIGHELWQSHLAGDPDIVGSTLRVGGVPHAVVGVMPEGFLFPYRDNLWVPLRYNPLDYERGQGPNGWIVGRLADGVSMRDARTEMEIVGQRMAAEFPDTHEHLQPRVRSYTLAREGGDPEAIVVVELLALLLLALACGNVGILILARAATRSGEIAIRTALGARRIRIVSQFFIESFVLAVLAAGVGLMIGQVVVGQFDELLGRADFPFPYWIDLGLSLETVVLAMSLAGFSAVIAGIVPALKATGRNVHVSMQRASGGGSGIRFGVPSSVLIVAEVAVATCLLTFGAALAPSAALEPEGLGIDTEQYLYASLQIPRIVPITGGEDSYRSEFEGRVRRAHEELARRLASEPGIGRVAIANNLPGTAHRRDGIEIEGETQTHRVLVARVDVGYFDALEQPILSGRGFDMGDLGDNRTAIIVNTNFVERVLGGRNPLGRRVRYSPDWRVRYSQDGPDDERGDWHEIVGVVGHLGMNELDAEADAGFYHVAAPGELHPLRFAVRVGDNPTEFAPRLRSIVAEIDAGAMIRNPATLSDVFSEDRFSMKWGKFVVAVLGAIAIVLSAAGLYALMSFTVAERTREIGIRTALGALPASIVGMIAKRAFLQLFVGVVIGLAAGVWWTQLWWEQYLRASNLPLAIGLVALGVLVVGMLACVSPTRRGLRIRPAETLNG